MYNDEERTSFSIKNIIIQILFVLLFIFLLMWLFPTKSQMNEAVQPFYNRIFNENMMIVKDAAKSYFTLERLPQNVGDKVKLTLGDMLEKKLILSFLDGNNNRCDENRSYVEVTKMDNEYVMKIYLSCSDNQDYILVHMGCYDYCKTTICEKEKEEVVSNPTRPTITIPVDPTPTPTPTPVTKYKCEYLKVTDGYYTDWSSWSEWSTNISYKNDLTDVESKVETTTKEVQKLIGYNVVTYKDYNKPIYKEVQYQSGTKIQTVCIEEGIEYEFVGYSDWISQGTQRFGTAMSDSDSTYYVLKSTGHDDGCGECNNGLYYLYEVYTRTKVYKENTVCKKTENREVPLYTTEQILIGYEILTRKDPVYQTITEKTDTTYYRFRTRKLIKGTEDRKWSTCDNSSLLNSGYSIIQKIEDK